MGSLQIQIRTMAWEKERHRERQWEKKERERVSHPPVLCVNSTGCSLYKMTFIKSAASYFYHLHQLLQRSFFLICLHHMTYLHLTCPVFYHSVPDPVEYLPSLWHCTIYHWYTEQRATKQNRRLFFSYKCLKGEHTHTHECAAKLWLKSSLSLF